MIVGLVAPLSILPATSIRNTEAFSNRNNGICTSRISQRTKGESFWMHSAATTRTELHSLPSDEELFLSLFHDKEEEKTDGKSTNAVGQKQLSATSTTPPPSFNFEMGAGSPRPSLEPDEIVPMLMTALQNVDVPNEDGGLISMWDFASDTTKFIFKNNRTGEFNMKCNGNTDDKGSNKRCIAHECTPFL